MKANASPKVRGGSSFPKMERGTILIDNDSSGQSDHRRATIRRTSAGIRHE
jgi:hypothetical protein